jgi:hypothetical protein
MSVPLSAEQQQALDQSAGRLLYVTDPRTSAAYLLIPADQYENIREVLEDRRVQQAVRSTAVRNAVSRSDEDPWSDPAKSTWPNSRKRAATR